MYMKKVMGKVYRPVDYRALAHGLRYRSGMGPRQPKRQLPPLPALRPLLNCREYTGNNGSHAGTGKAGDDHVYRSEESNQADVDATKKYMEEQSGVKFEVKKIAVAADFISSVNLSLASNEDIDVILVQSNDHFQSLVQRGALQVINEPLEKYGPNLRKIYTEDAWKSVSDKEGNILGIPRQSAPFGSLIANRKD